MLFLIECAVLTIFLVADPAFGRGSNEHPVNNFGGFIINGIVTRPHGYPWTVHITTEWDDKSRSECGGSLISEDQVVTAAHCAKKQYFYSKQIAQASSFTVILGAHDLAVDESVETERRIFKLTMDNAHVHPNFTFVEFANDIAVLVLPEKVRLTATIKTVRIPDKTMCSDNFSSPRKYNNECEEIKTVGWGLTEHGSTSNVLKEIVVVAKRMDCLRFFEIFNRTTQICGKGVNKSDSCQGDSGGPLMCLPKSMSGTILIGLTSAGHKGCSRNYHTPGIYTQLCGYLDWLHSLKKKMRYSFGSYCIGEPRTIRNGRVFSGESNLGSRRNIECNPGYELIGRGFASCTSSRVWRIRGRCQAEVTCHLPEPTSLISYNVMEPASVINDRDVISGGTVHASCHRRYHAGPLVSMCGPDGQWRPPLLTTCKPAATQNCGKPITVDWMINGLYRVGASEMPWIVRIKIRRSRNKIKYCSGSLIADRWVITSAYCFNGGFVRQIQVQFGRTDFTTSSQPGQFTMIADHYFLHDSYNATTLDFNVAMVELTEAVSSSSNAKPICLPDNICDPGTTRFLSSRIDGCSEVVVGTWNVSDPNGDLSRPVLKRVLMNMWSNSSCTSRAIQSRIGLGEGKLCASSIYPGQDACRGDTGGPMMCQNGSNVYLVGLVSASFNSVCGSVNDPGIYTRVCSVMPWITQVMRRN